MSINTVYEKPITLRVLKELFGGTSEEVATLIIELERVSLEGQGLTSLDGLDMFARVKCADLSFNQIRELSPDILELLPSLEVLSVARNAVHRFPDLSGLSFTHLKQLNVAFNPLGSIPVSHLPKTLETLCLSADQVPGDPEEFKREIHGHCPAFKELAIVSGDDLPISIQNDVQRQIAQTQREQHDSLAVKLDKEGNVVEQQSQEKKGPTTSRQKAPLSSRQSTRTTKKPPPKLAEALVPVPPDEKLQQEQRAERATAELEDKVAAAINVIDEIDDNFLRLEQYTTDLVQRSRKREQRLFEHMAEQAAPPQRAPGERPGGGETPFTGL
ncbi:Leucine-rich repeat protein [Giardia muris]|uniref:Leucine-rich repeat protein n=1 Tax=Giardia muris TaxID=5742 RepID=A0A4Z1SZI6_GIAMU|nr:Leucine-rich repeat protein [Giardia muris]|eukprot:TNJ27063.1 Leucine-rich repeat protein [Giardia muris]